LVSIFALNIKQPAEHYKKCERERTKAQEETTIYASQMLCMISQDIDPRREKREEERKVLRHAGLQRPDIELRSMWEREKEKSKLCFLHNRKKTLSYKRHQEA